MFQDVHDALLYRFDNVDSLNRYGIRVLPSSDGNIQYVVVYSLACPDACIMISQNLQNQRAVSILYGLIMLL